MAREAEEGFALVQRLINGGFQKVEMERFCQKRKSPSRLKCGLELRREE